MFTFFNYADQYATNNEHLVVSGSSFFLRLSVLPLRLEPYSLTVNTTTTDISMSRKLSSLVDCIHAMPDQSVTDSNGYYGIIPAMYVLFRGSLVALKATVSTVTSITQHS